MPNVCDPVSPPPPCNPSDKTEQICYVDAGGCEHSGTRRFVQNAQCVITLNEIRNLAGVVQTGVTVVPCTPGIRVTNLCEIAPPPPAAPAPTTATGVDCAGAPVSATGVGVVQSVPHPDAVQKVQICAGSITDRELVTRCNAAGQTILLTYDVITSPPTILSRWNLVTNAAEPAASVLVPCGEAVELDIEQTEGCAANVSSTRVRVFNQTTGALNSQTFINAAGVVIPAPAGWAQGPCGAVSVKQIIYGEPVCVQGPVGVYSSAVPYSLYDGVTIAAQGYLDPATMAPKTGVTPTGNPCDCPCITCNPALTITKSVNPVSPPAGSTATFTLVVGNTGPGIATLANITDILPASLVPIAGSLTGGATRTQVGQNLAWTVNNLHQGQTATLTFQARVVSSTLAPITNTATASAAGVPDVTGSVTFTPSSCPGFARFTNVFGGTMNGVPFTIAYNLDPAGSSGFYNTAISGINPNSQFPAPAFTPPGVLVSSVGVTVFGGINPAGSTNSFEITFGAPVTDIQLHLQGLDQTDFIVDVANSPGVTGTSLASVGTAPGGLLALPGNRYSWPGARPGAAGNNGTINVNGTFTTLRLRNIVIHPAGDGFGIAMSDCV